MKSFLSAATILLAITPSLIAATPMELDTRSPEVIGERALEKRQTCHVKIKYAPDTDGTCVDTTKAHTCDNGLLIRGYCDGAWNIICCIDNKWFTPQH